MRVQWETIAAADPATVRLLALKLRRFAGGLHAHAAWELTWVRRGSGIRSVADRVEPFGPDDLVLVAPGVPHQWWSTGPETGGVQAVVVQWSADAGLNHLPEWREWQERRAAQGAAAWQIDKKQAPELHARLCALWAPLTEQAPPLDRIAALLSTLAALQSQETLLRPVGQRLEGRSTGVGLDGTDDPRRMEQLLRWVHQQWNRDLPLETAAAHLHLTPGAFSRAFKRRLGITFVRYVNDLRIARACMALLQTDRPIARIAEDCGYASLSHFQQQFQARKGTTPSSYRGSVQHRETHRHAGDAPASKRQQLRR